MGNPVGSSAVTMPFVAVATGERRLLHGLARGMLVWTPSTRLVASDPNQHGKSPPPIWSLSLSLDDARLSPRNTLTKAEGSIMGSVEFCCTQLGSRLILVLGHSHCKAIEEATRRVGTHVCGSVGG